VAGGLAYLAGSAGVGAAEPFRTGLPAIPSEVITTLGVEVQVVRYDSEDAVCVKSANGESCTRADADVPMVQFMDGRDGEEVVVVDPQGKSDVVRVTDANGNRRDHIFGPDSLAIRIPIEGALRLEVLGLDGEPIFVVDLASVEALRQLADDAKNTQPHH
jgi:hypothetical protein